MGKKRFFANHSKSSAMVVSLAIHAILILVAIFFVAVKVIVKEDTVFVEQRVKRPKMPPKKIQVPVDTKKSKPKPKLRKRIVSERKMADIKMPEITGVKGGLGNMGGDGMGSLGFDMEIGDLFGSSTSMGNELAGIFYDLKQTDKQKPTQMNDAKYYEALSRFAKSWDARRFDNFFKAPKQKYATFFMISPRPANAAPKAYGVEDVVQPKHWVAHYKGQISAPETGHYRFCGFGDDVLVVRVKNRVVLDASWFQGKVTNWSSDDPNNGLYPLHIENAVRGAIIGDWIKLTKGRPVEIEILFGECPGGKFSCQLLMEQKGKEYKQAPYSYKDGDKEVAGTRPILPIFKTTEISDALRKQIRVSPNVATLEGPTFGVQE